MVNNPSGSDPDPLASAGFSYNFYKLGIDQAHDTDPSNVNEGRKCGVSWGK